jgi:hypothetical protein
MSLRLAAVVVMLLWTCCPFAGSAGPQQDAATVVEVGRVKSKFLVEASGLVRSRRNAEVFWTHNDGDDGVLHAIRRDGSVVARVRVAAKFHDWEDVAADAHGDLFLADVGNNSRDRKRVTVYRIAEPDPGAAKANAVPVLQEWKLTFPDRPFDCEGLFVWKDHGYLVSKTEAGQRAGVYRFPLGSAATVRRQLEHVVTLPVDEPVTAADISHDGRQLAVLSRGSLRVFAVDGEIKQLADSSPKRYAIPPIQAEGCCFTPDGVLVIAETGELLLVRAEAVVPATQPASK